MVVPYSELPLEILSQKGFIFSSPSRVVAIKELKVVTAAGLSSTTLNRLLAPEGDDALV